MALRSSQQIRSVPKELDFAPSEQPPWRTGTSLPETTNMFSQILEWQRSAADWTAEQIEFVRSTFNRREAVDFVLLSNQMEREGTQDSGSTEELVVAAMGVESSKSQYSAAELATIQTYKAMAWLFTKRTEMVKEAQNNPQESLYLTTSLIMEAHKVLMAGLVSNAGEFRQSEAYPSGSDYFYMSPHLIEAHLESILDTYNSIVRHTELSGESVFKLAAWFLYHFLTIHPFSDGNGRLARILANSILFLHVPFPVALKPRATNTSFAGDIDRWREHYINAIVECRQDKKVSASPHRPRDLSALFIQSAWHGWKSLVEALDCRTTRSLGPLVISNSSNIKKEELALKVSKWNKQCDAQAAASEIIRQLGISNHGEFSIVLSDGKNLMIVDRTPVDNTPPPPIPYADTMLKIHLP